MLVHDYELFTMNENEDIKSIFSRFTNIINALNSHLHAAKRIFKYLAYTPSLGLWYPRNSSFDLHTYPDADFGGYKVDRKSTSDTCQFLGNMLISWFSKKQNSVALSTTEAE
ncbi:hypothetical protein CFOL_v3_06959 [Cephalotus follicularis]|uniref:UBN2_3 domain-containing protein n=1 Tax=Cephalotus follicularis TaxID=3775 RepID=A0A1Q3B5Z7_CEPFO|nr:hypothetical protein CFOL_v3_06959 [Cephalotus follicularis]